jgi:hypothetical protein
VLYGYILLIVEIEIDFFNCLCVILYFCQVGWFMLIGLFSSLFFYVWHRSVVESFAWKFLLARKLIMLSKYIGFSLLVVDFLC